MESIVGMTWRDRSVLLASEHSTTRGCKDFVAVGIGSDHASMLLSRIVQVKKDITMELAGYLAAYTIFHVKEYIEGCGKGTHVTMLSAGEGEYFSEKAITIMEERFAAYMRLEAATIHYVLGRSLSDQDSDSKRLLGRLIELRQEMQQLPETHFDAEWDLDWADTPRTQSSGR